MAQANRTVRSSARPARLKPGVKKEQILKVATDHFGRYGYEDTKWADVAAAVDIGSTALYHYFESKQHCLFEIMAAPCASSARGSTASSPRTTTGKRRWSPCSSTRSRSASADVLQAPRADGRSTAGSRCRARFRARRRPASTCAR